MKKCIKQVCFIQLYASPKTNNDSINVKKSLTQNWQFYLIISRKSTSNPSRFWYPILWCEFQRKIDTKTKSKKIVQCIIKSTPFTKWIQSTCNVKKIKNTFAIKINKEWKLFSLNLHDKNIKICLTFQSCCWLILNGHNFTSFLIFPGEKSLFFSVTLW